MPAVQATSTPTPTGPVAPQSTKKDNDFPPIPTGVYDAEVTRINYRSKADALASGGFWPEWKTYDHEVNFGFRITNGEYKNRWFWLDAEFVFDKGSKLRSIVENIMGFKVPDDYVFDTDDEDAYIGCDCQLRIVRKPNKKGVEVNYVQEVLKAEPVNTYDDVDQIF